MVENVHKPKKMFTWLKIFMGQKSMFRGLKYVNMWVKRNHEFKKILQIFGFTCMNLSFFELFSLLS
jgi:hypothetical protein